MRPMCPKCRANSMYLENQWGKPLYRCLCGFIHSSSWDFDSLMSQVETTKTNFKNWEEHQCNPNSLNYYKRGNKTP